MFSPEQINENLLIAANEIEEVMNFQHQEGWYVICGNAALVVNGISLGRNLNDVDIRLFCENPDIVRAGLVLMPVRVDVLSNAIDVNVEYVPKMIDGKEFLVQTVQNTIDTKYLLQKYWEETVGEECPKLEKIRRDLAYLKDTYNLGPNPNL